MNSAFHLVFSSKQLIKIIVATNSMENLQFLPKINYETIDTMFSYATERNIPWGNKEYKTPRQYFDPINQDPSKKYPGQKKGQKDKKYVTKRGHFMEYDLKIAKSIPSPADHSLASQWKFQEEKKIAKFRKVDPKHIKGTYLQKIQINQQKRKSPGVCTYSLQKSLKEKQELIEKEKSKKIMQERRRFFHQDIQYLGGGGPGSGNYNPHDEVMKIRKDKTDWKLWVDKHKKVQESFLKRDSVKPSSFSYSPMNVTLNTFDRITISPKGKTKVPGFGTSARFHYQSPDKKKTKQVRPSPAHYRTTLEWRSKKQSPGFKPWNTSIWKGRQFSSVSVYE